jgi:glucose uptake protein GlcU|tara:strand:- start:6 stop:233 length:228 start_codon:yes stop_codon:yes gene_type:complete
MSKFIDSKGKESMMRKITWIVILTALAWGTGEIIFNFINPEFNIHETLILTTLGAAITGKVGQKIVENKTPKDEQ